MRTPILNPVDPTYAELEVHRTMICDRVRTEAFKGAIDTVVRPGDVVLDVGAGSGILSLLAARAGAARVYAVERTAVAELARRLAIANGFGEVVRVLRGDVSDVDLPERVDVIVSEWLGGFGIDEGMLPFVVDARDRWLKPGGTMIPGSVTAWTALVEDRYLAESVGLLRADPYGIDLSELARLTVNEIAYSGSLRHLTRNDLRSSSERLWTTNAGAVSIDDARAPHEAEAALRIVSGGTANALALWFSASLAPSVDLSVGPGDAPTHWGMTSAPLRSPIACAAGSVVRARVGTELARPMGTWTSWAIAEPGRAWEAHDERLVWEEIDD